MKKRRKKMRKGKGTG
ncbi:hypothetical protein CUMW_120060 [Citrus unshiu]|uniref:Uncharacterized protein n=1 Tax=Citrus unshiu TaxID=55188 RepID=A0A2H5PB15_CITUN|nr:hypothetical protein CUMW_120060 [Citrus unshiu]